MRRCQGLRRRQGLRCGKSKSARGVGLETCTCLAGAPTSLRSSEGERAWRAAGGSWVQTLQRGSRSLLPSPAVLALCAADKDVHLTAFDKKRNIPASVTGDQLRALVPQAAPRLTVPTAHIHTHGCRRGRWEVHAWVSGAATWCSGQREVCASTAQHSVGRWVPHRRAGCGRDASGHRQVGRSF